MQKINLLLAVCWLLILASCATADQKIPEMANAYCGCNDKASISLSREAQQIIINVSQSPNPGEAMQAELGKIPADKKLLLEEEIAKMKDTDFGKCLHDVDKKFESAKTSDRKKTIRKLIAALDKHPDCKLVSSLMHLSEKQNLK